MPFNELRPKLPSPDPTPLSQNQTLTISQTIALLSAKFDETKNLALEAIAQLESQLVSLSNSIKKDQSNANPG
jgi:hypothetical protein